MANNIVSINDNLYRWYNINKPFLSTDNTYDACLNLTCGSNEIKQLYLNAAGQYECKCIESPEILKKDINLLNKKIIDMETAADNASNIIDKLENDLNTSNSELNLTKIELANVKNAKNILSNEISTATDEINSLLESGGASSKELASIKDDRNEMVDQLNDVNERLSVLTNNALVLEDKIFVLEKNLDKANINIDDLVNDLDDANNEMQELDIKLELSEEKVSELTATLNTTTAQRDDLKTELKISQGDIEELTDILKLTVAENKSLTDNLKTSNNSITTLTNDLDSTTISRDALQKSLDSANNEVSSLLLSGGTSDKELLAVTAERNAFNKQLTDANIKISTLTNNLLNMTNDRDKLQDDLDYANSLLTQMQTDASILKKNNNTLQDDNDKLGIENTALQNSLDAAILEYNNSNDELKAQTDEKKILINNAKLLELDIDEANNEIDKIRTDLVTSTASNKNLNNSLDTALDNLSDLTDELNLTVNDLKIANESILVYKAETKKMLGEISILEQKLFISETEVDKLTENLESTNMDLTSANAKLKEQTIENDNLSKQMAISNSKIAQLTSDLATRTSERSDLSQKLGDANKIITNLTGSVSDLTAERDTLQDKLGSVNDRILNQANDLAIMTAERDDLTSDMDAAKIEISDLAKKLEEMTLSEKKIKQILDDANTQIKILQAVVPHPCPELNCGGYVQLSSDGASCICIDPIYPAHLTSKIPNIQMPNKLIISPITNSYIPAPGTGMALSIPDDGITLGDTTINTNGVIAYDNFTIDIFNNLVTSSDGDTFIYTNMPMSILANGSNGITLASIMTIANSVYKSQAESYPDVILNNGTIISPSNNSYTLPGSKSSMAIPYGGGAVGDVVINKSGTITLADGTILNLSDNTATYLYNNEVLDLTMAINEKSNAVKLSDVMSLNDVYKLNKTVGFANLELTNGTIISPSTNTYIPSGSSTPIAVPDNGIEFNDGTKINPDGTITLNSGDTIDLYNNTIKTSPSGTVFTLSSDDQTPLSNKTMGFSVDDLELLDDVYPPDLTSNLNNIQLSDGTVINFKNNSYTRPGSNPVSIPDGGVSIGDNTINADGSVLLDDNSVIDVFKNTVKYANGKSYSLTKLLTKPLSDGSNGYSTNSFDTLNDVYLPSQLVGFPDIQLKDGYIISPSTNTYTLPGSNPVVIPDGGVSFGSITVGYNGVISMYDDRASIDVYNNIIKTERGEKIDISDLNYIMLRNGSLGISETLWLPESGLFGKFYNVNIGNYPKYLLLSSGTKVNWINATYTLSNGNIKPFPNNGMILDGAKFERQERDPLTALITLQTGTTITQDNYSMIVTYETGYTHLNPYLGGNIAKMDDNNVVFLSEDDMFEDSRMFNKSMYTSSALYDRLPKYLILSSGAIIDWVNLLYTTSEGVTKSLPYDNLTLDGVKFERYPFDKQLSVVPFSIITFSSGIVMALTQFFQITYTSGAQSYGEIGSKISETDINKVIFISEDAINAKTDIFPKGTVPDPRYYDSLPKYLLLSSGAVIDWVNSLYTTSDGVTKPIPPKSLMIDGVKLEQSKVTPNAYAPLHAVITFPSGAKILTDHAYLRVVSKTNNISYAHIGYRISEKDDNDVIFISEDKINTRT
jgi:predicted  nucleic acid-binding Zn-ribbon protein